MRTLNLIASLIARTLFISMLVSPAITSAQPMKALERSDDSIKVIELRNHAIHPGQLSKFVDFMNRIIIPRQESQRGHVLNQFGLKGSDNNYVWMRGFYDMQTRSQFLHDFYSSEYWKQHRDETNSMLANIEYIYLLRPVLIKNDTAELEVSVPRDALKQTKGIAVVDFYTTNQKRDQLIDFFAKEYLPNLRKAGISKTQLWISEMAKNDFWLPAIQDPNLLVAISRYEDEADFKAKQRKANEQLTQPIKARLKELATSHQSQIVYPLDVTPIPTARGMRSRKVDIKHVALDLRFDWQKKRAYGTASVTLSPLAATNFVTLDAAELSIDSVTLNGTALKFDYDGSDKNDNLRITLDRTYNAGAKVIIKIRYSTNHVNRVDPGSLSGTDGKGIRFSEPTANDPLKIREIWALGDPESNRYWFPGYDSPDDLRTTEFVATVESKFTVISNGRLLETKDNLDGTRTFRWRSDTPYANHLTSFVIGEFVAVKQAYQDIELHNFGYARERDWVAASVERLPDMVRFFSEKTGVKYPYQTYSQVFVQEIGAFTGKPNMNFATITENMVDDYATHADYFYLWDLTEAEALAGQWFGGYVTAKEWSDVWLNKGFAHYFNCLYNENKNGRDEWLLWVHNFDHGSYHSDWNSGNRHPIVTRHYESAAVFTSDSYPNVRGGLVLHMLRKHLGEALWWQTIRHYLKANAHKTVVTDDLRRAVEKTSGQPFEWFFNQWVYKMGHPIFEVTKNYADGKLVLIVKQTQKSDPNSEFPQVDFFQGKLEIEIDGRVEQVWLERKFENVFTFASPGPPKFVNFDFQSTWIKEIKFEQSFAELLQLFQSSRDVLARQAAMIELVRIAKSEECSATDKVKFQTALRNTIRGNDYWRLRNAAMSQLVGLYPAGSFDEATIATLLSVIKNDKSWVRAAAIGFLGTTRDAKYADVYLAALNDESFRVINSAAIALGRSKSPKAYDALAKLKDKPSMKSQSLISALAGLKALGDPRGFEIAFDALSNLNLPRWRLSAIPPTWDYRDFAVDTIASLGKGDKAYPLVFERLKTALSEDDLSGVFTNLLLITALADPRGQEAFDLLKEKFKHDASIVSVVAANEAQFKNALKNAAPAKPN